MFEVSCYISGLDEQGQQKPKLGHSNMS